MVINKGNCGVLFQHLRKDLYISQEDLGKMLGISRQSVSNIERGIHLPRFSTLILFEKLYEDELKKQSQVGDKFRP